MNEQAPHSRHDISADLSSLSADLPLHPSVVFLRKTAKDLTKSQPGLQLSRAQHQLAKHYGFANWADLIRHVESSETTHVWGSRLEQAVFHGKLDELRVLLDEQPDAIHLLIGQWNKPPLHMAAWEGHVDIVRELVRRGADVNERCETDHACPIHFAAERGHLEVVRFLIREGSEIEASNNDHKQSVLGWAVCLGDQKKVGKVLLEAGVRHSIWTAVAMGDEAEVRRLVSSDPNVLNARMSQFEYHRTPFLFALHRGNKQMADLLVELGADTRARDSLDLQTANPDLDLTDEVVLEHLNTESLELADALASNLFEEAERLWKQDPDVLRPGGEQSHLFVHAVLRRNWASAKWILDHGGDVNAMATAYGCPATALHFLVESGPADRVEWLLERGADPEIEDGKHHATAIGWCEFFGKTELAERLKEHRK